MTDKIEHLMLEHFRRLRDDIAKIQVSLDSMRSEVFATRHHTRGLELTSETPSPYEPRPTKRG